MAEITANCSVASGRIESSNATYATARTGGTLAATVNPATGYCGQTYTTSYFLSEAFFDFDTSAIAAEDTVTAAVLSLYCSDNYGNDTAHIQQAYVKDWSTSLTTDDWVSGADIDGGSLGSAVATFDTTGLTDGVWCEFTSAGLADAIVKGGTTRLLVCSNRFVAGTQPTNKERILWSFPAAGGSYQPKLVVTYIGFSGLTVTRTLAG